MKYTKKQRHEIYKKALDYLVEPHIFLRNITDGVSLATNGQATISDFKEIMMFSPDDNYDWWHREDKKSRINCLLFCIEMTK